MHIKAKNIKKYIFFKRYQINIDQKQTLPFFSTNLALVGGALSVGRGEGAVKGAPPQREGGYGGRSLHTQTNFIHTKTTHILY